jgi:hypothetical protein
MNVKVILEEKVKEPLLFPKNGKQDLLEKCNSKLRL